MHLVITCPILVYNTGDLSIWVKSWTGYLKVCLNHLYYWVYTFTGLFGVRKLVGQDATTSMLIILTLAKVPLPRGWRVTWHKIELNINSFTKTGTLDSILEKGKTTKKQWSWKREIEGLSSIGLWKETIWPTQPHVPDGILDTDYQGRHWKMIIHPCYGR